MRVIEETDYKRLYAEGVGYLYNDFDGPGASGKGGNMLHQAACRTLPMSNTQVPKHYFSTITWAEEWLQQERGPEGSAWLRCKTCFNSV